MRIQGAAGVKARPATRPAHIADKALFPFSNPMPNLVYPQPLGYTTSADYSEGIVAADFNGDGKLDLAVGSQCDTVASPCPTVGVVSIFLSNGDGTFQPAVTYPALGGGTSFLAAADFNADGKMDLVAVDGCHDASCDGAVSVFYGNGDGTLQTSVDYGTGTYGAESVAVGDLNHDGRPDFVVLSGAGLVGGHLSCSSVFTTFLNNGDGTFSGFNQVNNGVCGETYYQMAMADFNRDGNLDMAFSGVDPSSAESIMRIWLGDGSGTFASAGAFGVANHGPYSITTGDYNRDGIADLAFINSTADPTGMTPGAVYVWIGDGAGGFTYVASYVLDISVAQVTTADVNQDGNPDLIADSYQGTLSVLLGQGNGYFAAPVPYLVGDYPYQATAGDWNGDAKPDIAVVDQCADDNCLSRTGVVSLLTGNGDGTLQAPLDFRSLGNYGAKAAVVADVNGDGKPDMLVANEAVAYNNFTNGTLGVMLGNGDGTFQAAQTFASGGRYTYSVAVGDVNGDGKPDAVLANTSSSTGYGDLAVLLGNDDGTFQAAQTFSSGGFYPAAVAVADVNGDGKPDLVSANYCTSSSDCSGSIGILPGNGDGTFQPAVSLASGGVNAFSIQVADVNGDSKPDLIVANACNSQSDCSNGNVAVLMGNGDGTFQPAQTYLSGGSSTVYARVADVNADGKLDLIAANECSSSSSCNNGTIGVLLGNGDGTFQPAQPYGTGAYAALGLAVADVNGDGKPDVFAANYYCYATPCAGATASLLLGNGDGTFQSAQLYGLPFRYASAAALADVDRDGRMDAIVGAETVFVPFDNRVEVFRNQSGTPAATTTTVTSSLTSFTAYQPLALTAQASSTLNGTYSGTFNFTDNGAPIGSAAANSSGQGTLIVSTLGAGAHFIVGYYSGDSTFAPSNSLGIHLTGSQATSTTSVSASPNPSAQLQQVTLTATITPQYSGAATGTVTFTDGATTLGISAVSGNAATLTTALAGAGAHNITAQYGGDGNLLGSTSGVYAQTVAKASTTTSLTSSANPAAINQAVTYTATVAGQYGGTVTGTVTFMDGSTVLATVAVAGNQAGASASYTKLGTHTITATYNGDANYTTSTSPAFSEYIKTLPVTSKTVVVTSLSPSLINQPVTFTATVTSSFGNIPDGETVNFLDGTTQIGTGATSGGMAMFTTSALSAKTHTIKASYVGDSSFKASTGTVSQTVTLYSTTTALVSNLNPSLSGQPVTFTATVTTAAPSVATGKVTFKDGTKSLGTVTLDINGVATLTKSTLTVGSHSITATYNGDTLSGKSTSNTVVQVVN
jgi:hypothetical protein